MPSSHVNGDLHLPIPALTVREQRQSSSKVADTEQAAPSTHTLSAEGLIRLTFDLHPDIKSSYQRFRSEEARYDFFYTSRDSMTPRLGVSNAFGEARADEAVTRDRSHMAELVVEKRFFDTTEVDVGIGYRSSATDEALGDHPFVSAKLRYPLWASRERLERTSEEIFRRNELNDSQLAYIQRVRGQISGALYKFYGLCQQARTVSHYESWHADLVGLASRIADSANGDLEVDRQRLRAEITRVAAEVGVAAGWFDVQSAHMKRDAGIPFDAAIVLSDEPFNPFEGANLENLLESAYQTDPEIATLRNAMVNAQAQLDLAKRGRWDVALRLQGESALEGRGEKEGVSDWWASIGIDVSAVDPRVTNSLIRQAEANIGRFRHAITARENHIYVNTLEPLIRLDSLGESRRELVANLPRYVREYRDGVDAYLEGRLNMDDLLQRRKDIFDNQERISYHTYLLGANVTQLCTATGKFFELLETSSDSQSS